MKGWRKKTGLRRGLAVFVALAMVMTSAGMGFAADADSSENAPIQEDDFGGV